MKKIGPYTKKVIEYFRKPHNYGRMKNPDGVGKVGNTVCGDVMWLYIKVGEDKKPARNATPARHADASHAGRHSDAGGGKEIIKDIKFETFGCVAAIATSSVITDLAKGKTLENALKIDKKQIVESLGGLPPIKLHCSVLAADALYEAIYDYFSKSKREIPKDLEEKHKSIKEERERIKEKYKDWTEVEEKMHTQE